MFCHALTIIIFYTKLTTVNSFQCFAVFSNAFTILSYCELINYTQHCSYVVWWISEIRANWKKYIDLLYTVCISERCGLILRVGVIQNGTVDAVVERLLHYVSRVRFPYGTNICMIYIY